MCHVISHHFLHLATQAICHHLGLARQRPVDILATESEMLDINRSPQLVGNHIRIIKHAFKIPLLEHYPLRGFEILIAFFLGNVEIEHRSVHYITLCDRINFTRHRRLIRQPHHILIIEFHRAGTIIHQRRGREIRTTTLLLKTFKALHHILILHHVIGIESSMGSIEYVVFMQRNSPGIEQIELEQEAAFAAGSHAIADTRIIDQCHILGARDKSIEIISIQLLGAR